MHYINILKWNEGEWGKIQYMKVPIFDPKYWIYTSQVCTTFWVGGLIGTSEECVYGVIGISKHILGSKRL